MQFRGKGHVSCLSTDPVSILGDCRMHVVFAVK